MPGNHFKVSPMSFNQMFHFYLLSTSDTILLLIETWKNGDILTRQALNNLYHVVFHSKLLRHNISCHREKKLLFDTFPALCPSFTKTWKLEIILVLSESFLHPEVCVKIWRIEYLLFLFHECLANNVCGKFLR